MKKITTRSDMESLVGEIAEKQLAYDATVCQMDRDIQSIRDRYEPELKRYKTALEHLVLLAEEWALANEPEFGKLKSIDMVHGVVGFRTGTPKLKTLKGWTWAKVLDNLKRSFVSAGYIRIAEEVDKEKIIADRKELGTDKLKAFGVQIAQDENFFVEPKREQLSEARLVS
jgi:phage host-nuclease inhibitor protein Gam